MKKDFDKFLQVQEKKLHKRIKSIVSLTVDDFHNSGYSTDESQESLKAWLVSDLKALNGIDDLNTYQISILILDKLKSLDIIDLEFIHNLLFADIQSSEVSITFKAVGL